MKKPWILIGILFMANTAWAQQENAANEEPPKAKQRTGVLSSSLPPEGSSGSETSANNILVKNIPYQPSATKAQTSVESKEPASSPATPSRTAIESRKPAPPSAIESRNFVESKKPDLPSAAPSQASVESKKPDLSPVTPSKTSVESKKTDPSPATPSQTSAGSDKPVLQSKPTENSSRSDPRDSACRLGGYLEENMSPEECRRQGGMMITTSRTSAGSDKTVPQSKQTENSSMFNPRNSVCRLRGHEKKDMSPEECKNQGGMMITTGDVPTYHEPPINGRYLGKQ